MSRCLASRCGARGLRGDPDAIGQQVTLDDRSFTVVGVMPEAFQFPYGAASVLRGAMAESRVDVWIAEYRPLRGRLSRLVARLKPGATQAAAAAEIAADRGSPSVVERGTRNGWNEHRSCPMPTPCSVRLADRSGCFSVPWLSS